jgi:hypothetical protein
MEKKQAGEEKAERAKKKMYCEWHPSQRGARMRARRLGLNVTKRALVNVHNKRRSII